MHCEVIYSEIIQFQIIVKYLSSAFSGMFRRILPIARRSFPKIMKVGFFSLSFMMLNYHATIADKVKCISLPIFQKNIFLEVLPKIIRIQDNGEIVGYAYCFAERLLVTPSHELLDKNSKKNKYEYFLGDQKLETNFKIIGNFELLTFIEAEHSLFPVLPSKEVELYTPIHVVQNRSHLSIRDGYYVDKESGYGIINSKAEVGSLVLNSNGIVGIVNQIGRDADYGFLRVILWKDIKNAYHRLKRHKESSIYLGMSAVSATDQKEGISIVRVAPNSPLSNYIKMGDTVTKVNGHIVRNPDDLTRLIMFSDTKVTFEIQCEDKTRKLITIQL